MKLDIAFFHCTGVIASAAWASTASVQL